MRTLFDQRGDRSHVRPAALVLLVVLALAALASGPIHRSAATAGTSVFLPLIAEPPHCNRAQKVYPITIRSDMLNENGFVNPDGRYSDERYKNKTYKRVYVQSLTNPSGGFSWLSWRAGPTTIISFTAALSGSGTLAKGFDEAPWPSPNRMNLPKPPGYPFFPHQLNVSDWVYSYAGSVNSAGVRAALDQQIANRTLMILLSHNAQAEAGAAETLLINRAGAFLLRGYNLSSIAYLDLVYIDPSALVVCAS